ncbi:hypothetical protein CYMTET_47173 [Cymbomonas tetramitiformis]|uniref:Uncharacterized protein n=1 Tax=Cymbomonas tetramitiformis TaxID=36881 RepID=A0AAE0BWA7_9CHLO|nr:hypothetical protein CYMTET_47173 [Cymbomonas tetramitiformis]
MSTQFVTFRCLETGDVVREIPIVWHLGDPFVTSDTLCNVFSLDKKEDLSVTSEYDDSVACSLDLFPVHAGFLHNVYGTPTDDNMPILVSDSESDDSDDEEDIIYTGECKTPRFSPNTKPKPTESVASTNLSKSDSTSSHASSFKWPADCKRVNKVPFDVDGNVTFGHHMSSPLPKPTGKGGLPLNKLDFHVTNRSWSHACATTWAEVTRQDAVKDCNSQVRLQNCLGEKLCRNTECSFFKTHDKEFVQTSSQQRGKRSASAFLGVEIEGPPCKKCQEPMEVITCGARATLVRIDLPAAEGHLLLFRHEGTHACQPMDKKGKAVVSKETQDAIKEALPVFGGRFTSEKLKNSATTVAFEKMLSSPDGSPIDVYKVAREMQDARAVRDVMKEHRATQRAPERAADDEVKEMKRILDSKGYRTLLFDTAPLNWFMCPLDLPWSPAKIMLLMDRILGKPPFIGCYACSDGGHSCINGRVVEKVATVVPGIGLIKLATFVLPAGERNVDEEKMWQGIDYACRTVAMEDADFAKYRDKEVWVKTNPKGEICFRPVGFVRDAGGGGWIGIRLNYNKFMRREDRKKYMTRDEAGNSLEKGCDLHLVANMGIHARCLDKSFEETQFRTLFTRWYEAQAPRRVMDARARLFDFIMEQESKSVQSSLSSLVLFYEGEGERTLQLFTQSKGANPAEQLFSKDGKLIGVNLPASEFLHLENVTYITQSAWLEHVGEGGHSQRDSRTNTLYDERRRVYTAMQRARHTAYDVLEEVREIYVTPGPVTTETRSHRPNQVRSMGKRTKTRVTIDEPGTPTPAIKLVRACLENPLEFQWQFDPNTEDPAARYVWQSSQEVDEALVVQYLETAVHFHSEHRYVDTRRVSVGSLDEVRYQTSTTKGHAQMLARMFLQPDKRLKVIQVGQPTVRLTARGRHDGFLDRSYTLSSGRGEPSRVIFGHLARAAQQRISCSCYSWRQTMTRVGRSTSVKLCLCLSTLLFRAGFKPGHAFYVQSGFTTEEIDDILTALGSRLTTGDRVGSEELAYGQWMVVPGTGRKARCAASESRKGCVTAKTHKQSQPILSKDGPRVVVMGRRKVNGQWVNHKFQFCLLHQCCATVLPNYCDVPPSPTDLVVAHGLSLTREQRLGAGALTFQEQ